MIMPCMKSTSACDRGGSFPVVDSGSFLLGLPGAPGWTTTGPATPFCFARAVEQKKPVRALAATNKPHATANMRPDRGLRKRYCQFRKLLSIWDWSGRKLVTKILTFSKLFPGQKGPCRGH
jgi:hypothetical protein